MIGQLVVDALATWRLTRAVTIDEINAPLRDAVHKRWPGSLAAYYVDCPHCVSTWAGVAVATRVLPRPVVYGLALSGAVSLGVDAVNYARDLLAERS